MKMKHYLMMSLVALVVVTMTSCLHVKVGDKEWFNGSHTNNTPTQVTQVGQDVAMNPFERLDVSGPFNVIFEQGTSHTVRVEGTTEQLSKITIYVKNGDLYIDQRKNESSGAFNGMRIFVTSPSIEGLELAGSGSITAPKALNVNDLNVELAGSGKVTLAELTCKNLKNEIAGSGEITMGMVKADEVRNETAGSGNIDIAGLTCRKVRNDIAGSGNTTLSNLNVEEVKSEIAGSGDVTLRGKVGSHSEDIAGSGKVDVSGLQ
jgi:ribosomal protein S17E